MARVSTYLNYAGTTEAAFNFYSEVFNSDFLEPIMRHNEVPPYPGQTPLSAEEGNMVMHVALPILGGHVLMGTDVLASRGMSVTAGTDVTLNLEPDTRAEADSLFQALAEGGKVEMPLQEMFWGGYFGILTDQFGMRWMFNCS